MGNDTRRSRIAEVDSQRATGKTRRLLERVRVRLGMVPNLMRVLANAPVALEGYLNFSEALAGGTLKPKVRAQIGLTVAECNMCSYCLGASALMGQRAGLSRHEIADAIRACSSNPRTDAVLKLARTIIVQRGEVGDPDLQRARAAGLTDGELVETVANIALNIFINYIDHVARPPIDIPEVRQSEKSGK